MSKTTAITEAKKSEKDVERDAEDYIDEFPACLFEVPPDLAPGIYRQSVGMFAPGEKFAWPDAATPRKPIDGSDFPELLSPKLIPLDEESREILIAMHQHRPHAMKARAEKAKAVLAGTVDANKLIPQVKRDEPKKAKKGKGTSMREAAEGGGADVTKVGPDGKPLTTREADKA